MGNGSHVLVFGDGHKLILYRLGPVYCLRAWFPQLTRDVGGTRRLDAVCLAWWFVMHR